MATRRLQSFSRPGRGGLRAITRCRALEKLYAAWALYTYVLNSHIDSLCEHFPVRVAAPACRILSTMVQTAM